MRLSGWGEKYRCLRCGYEWLGRKRTTGQKPARCASCRTPLWNTPKVKPSQVDIKALLHKWQELNLEVVLYIHHRYRHDDGDCHVSLRVGKDAGTCIASSYAASAAACFAECLPEVERWAARDAGTPAVRKSTG